MSSPVVLILHGWGSSKNSFTVICEKLKQGGFVVHAIDLPGFGEAEAPRTVWGVDEYLSYVRTFASKHIGGTFFLLGHSFGGRIGIKYAALHPQELGGLILYAAAGIPGQGFRKRFFSFLVRVGGRLLAVPIFEVFNEPIRRVFYRFVSPDYATARGIMKEVFRKVVAEDLAPYLSKITLPVLILWGRRDSVTPFSQGLLMQKLIPRATLVAHPDGHSWHKINPDTFVQAVEEFVNKVHKDNTLRSDDGGFRHDAV